MPVSIVSVSMEVTLWYSLYRLLHILSRSCMVTSPEVPSVRQFCCVAGEDISATADHFMGVGVLHAVEDKGVSILLKSVLAISALFLQSLDSISLIVNFDVVLLNIADVMVNIFVVLIDIVNVIVDTILKVVEFVVQVN